MRFLAFVLTIFALASANVPVRSQEKKSELDPLSQKLKAADSKERTKALEALAKLAAEAQPAASKVCEVALFDPDPAVKKSAHEALGKICPDAAPLILQLSEDKEAKTAVETAGKLGKLGARADGASPALMWAVDRYQKEPKKIEATIACLQALGEIVPLDVTIVHRIGVTATLPGDGGVGKAAVQALGKIGKTKPETRKVILKYLPGIYNCRWEEEVLEALRVAKEFGPDARPLARQLKLIAAGTNGEKEEIRQAAAEALAEVEKKK